MQRMRLVLADDHALFREGLAGIINAQPDMQVVGEASDGLEALVLSQELKPDLILMDVQMPGLDGIAATQQITQALPESIVIMLTVRGDDDKLLEALKNGAQGYLLKDISSREMLEMIRGAKRGEAALSPALAARVLDEFRRLTRLDAARKTDDCGLTEREQRVLHHVSQGAADKEIARKLGISVNTVKTHIRNILAKLHVSTRRQAARIAQSKGLL